MAVVDEIAIKLGIQTGDLKAALTDANASIKKFGKEGSESTDGFAESIKGVHKGMKELKEIFAVGGAIEAVRGFFDTAIKYANVHKEDTDANTEAVRRFGESYESITGIVGRVSVQMLGFLNRAGEAWGNLIAYVGNGGEAAMRAIEVTESAERNIEEIQKRRAETQKQILETQNRIVEAQEKQKEAAFDVLTPTQKVDELLRRMAETETIISTTKEGSLAHEKARVDLINMQTELTKASAEEQKKSLEEKAKADAEQKKRNHELALDFKDELELFELQLKSAKGLNEEEANRLKLLQLQKDEKAIHLQMADLEAKVEQHTITPAEREKLATLIDQDKKLTEQIGHQQQLISGAKDEAKALTDVTKELNAQSDIINHGNTLIAQRGSISTDYRKELQAQAATLEKQIAINKRLISDEFDRTHTENDTTVALHGQVGELEHQLTLIQQIINAYNGVWRPLGLHNLGSMSSDALQAELEQLNDQALKGKLEWQQKGYGGVGGSTYENTNYELFSDIDSIKAELAFRTKIQAAFAAGGRPEALQEYVAGGGNPLSFDTAMSNMNSWGQGDTQTAHQLNQLIGGINAVRATLGNVFPSAAAAAAVHG